MQNFRNFETQTQKTPDFTEVTLLQRLQKSSILVKRSFWTKQALLIKICHFCPNKKKIRSTRLFATTRSHADCKFPFNTIISYTRLLDPLEYEESKSNPG